MVTLRFSPLVVADRDRKRDIVFFGERVPFLSFHGMRWHDDTEQTVRNVATKKSGSLARGMDDERI